MPFGDSHAKKRSGLNKVSDKVYYREGHDPGNRASDTGNARASTTGPNCRTTLNQNLTDMENPHEQTRADRCFGGKNRIDQGGCCQGHGRPDRNRRRDGRRRRPCRPGWVGDIQARAPSPARGPQPGHGEPLTIKETSLPKFAPGAAFKDAVAEAFRKRQAEKAEAEMAAKPAKAAKGEKPGAAAGKPKKKK